MSTEQAPEGLEALLQDIQSEPADQQAKKRERKKKEAPDEGFTAVLWASADKLRAQMDAAEYKHLVLGLIFLKYISDTFVEQQQKVLAMVSNPDPTTTSGRRPTA